MGAFYVTVVKGQSPWLTKPFGTTFALKAALRESYYSLMQMQYTLFIAPLSVLHGGDPLSKENSKIPSPRPKSALPHL